MKNVHRIGLACTYARDAPVVGCGQFTDTARTCDSKVCGRVNAYQVGSPNSVSSNHTVSVDDLYVDGVSLTHGTVG